ncbi:hypothetical protein [Candidatus Mycoplasma haematobovis]|nr:hypothetical protein [Candidatus Mycoplasma haematobovis]
MLIYFGIKELLKPTTFKGKLVSKGFKPIRSDDIAHRDLEFESDQEE